MHNIRPSIKATVAGLALALALGAAPALAATYTGDSLSEDTTATITVTDTEAEVTVTAYKVATINFDYDVDQGIDPLYLWAGDLDTTATSDSTGISVATWVYLNYPDYIDSETGAVTEDFDVDGVDGFYDALAAAIRSGVVTIDEDDTYTTTADSDGSASLTVSQGIYVVITDNGVGYVHSVSSANVVPVWDEDAEEWVLSDWELEVKKTPISVDKQITNYDSDGSATVDAVGVGDTVSFEVTAAVPSYPENALSYVYTISDTMPSILDLDTSSIVVKGTYSADDTEYSDVLTNSDEVTYYTIEADEDGFTITFDYDEISGYEYIVVSYDTTVNSSAETATAYENDAVLTWSNSPYVEGNYTTDDDKTVVYTYGIDILKVNSDSEVLAGATFNLTDADGNTLYFVENSDGTYTLADTDVDSDYTADLVSDSNGSIIVQGLDTGTYTLAETVAPDDYNKLSYTIEVTISDDDLDGEPTLSGLYTSDTEETDGRVNVTVTNTAGFELPTTGEAGTVAFTVAGIGLLCTAVALVLRRKGDEE